MREPVPARWSHVAVAAAPRWHQAPHSQEAFGPIPRVSTIRRAAALNTWISPALKARCAPRVSSDRTEMSEDSEGIDRAVPGQDGIFRAAAKKFASGYCFFGASALKLVLSVIRFAMASGEVLDGS